MNLVPSAFKKIADGSKTIELRLNDEKRQRINVEDTVVFNCLGAKDIITSQVSQLHKFSDFEELYKALPLEKCGYTVAELDTAHYTDMEQYYTKEQIKKYGALGIELCNVSSICDVKEIITESDILKLLAPSVFNPTEERLLNRAKKYQEDENIPTKDEGYILKTSWRFKKTPWRFSLNVKAFSFKLLGVFSWWTDFSEYWKSDEKIRN